MLESALQKHFGFSAFRKGQKEVISRLLAHQSAGAVFPTGAGKSLCYQLPALFLPHMTLVVSPLLALMKDQMDFLSKHGIPAARLDSTLNRDEYNRILDRARSGDLRVLMISVERFKNERFRGQLQRMNLSLMVVDEAHCISEWGHNFRPDYLKLSAYRDDFSIPQVLLLTATATEKVIDDMCLKFGVPRENITMTGFYRSNLHLQVSPTPERPKNEHLLRRIRESPEDLSIIYVTRQRTAEDVAAYLCDNGIRAFAYHAGMPDEKRQRIQNEFMAGKIGFIVATIAFGMGIDKNNIRRVIHYDLPKSIESYSQEIGRSGRDGKASFCEVLANRDSISVLENFIYGDTPEKRAIGELLTKLQHHDDPVWECKLMALSFELDIRLLPLKTLLVYLEMEGILRPKYTRFDDYMFKYHVEPKTIIDRFRGERKSFVRSIFDHCHTKRVWTHVDMQSILQIHGWAERQRVVVALDYFEEKGWIELQSKQAVEAYDLLKQDYRADVLAEKMHRLFKSREKREIERIHNLVDFFESPSCISSRLAHYFGEDIKRDRCGHCSVCKTGPVAIRQTVQLPPLETHDCEVLTSQFMAAAAEHASTLNVTKFLCGISSPLLIKARAKKITHFGSLEKYPFLQVKEWVEQSLPV